ncbi:MAG: M20 family metallopeptidase [Eubacteriales bacterium]|nr:M20 family metallopeptidase [Eubacteriales bacterium]
MNISSDYKLANVQALIQELEPKYLSTEVALKIVANYRFFHQLPEPAWTELKTRRAIKERLETYAHVEILFDYEPGLLARIVNPSAKLKILYRADIDALPIKEETGLDFASKNDAMHACGHDGHISVALALVETIASNPENFSKDIEYYFIFQASEENLPSGAKTLIEDRLLAKFGPYELILGSHFTPQIMAGQIGVLPSGPATTANGFFKVSIEGISAHSSQPQNGNNPILIACQLVEAWERFALNGFDPKEYRVMTICQLNSGTVQNQIPARAEVAGSIRVLNSETEEKLITGMARLAKGIAVTNDAEISFRYQPGHPAVHNDSRIREKIIAYLESNSASHEFILEDFWSASEDFSYYQELAPVYYIHLGSAKDSEAMKYSNHHPKFLIDPKGLIMAAEFWAGFLANLDLS